MIPPLKVLVLLLALRRERARLDDWARWMAWQDGRHPNWCRCPLCNTELDWAHRWVQIR